MSTKAEQNGLFAILDFLANCKFPFEAYINELEAMATLQYVQAAFLCTKRNLSIGHICVHPRSTKGRLAD